MCIKVTIMSVEIDVRNQSLNYNMSVPHQHPKYEITFLLQGTREIFRGNNVFVAYAKSFFVIPPCVKHRTNGGQYKRVNFHVDATDLTQSEKEFLDNCACFNALPFDQNNGFCSELLTQAINSTTTELSDKKRYQSSIFQTILFYLQHQNFCEIGGALSTVKTFSPNALISKIVQYLHKNYQSIITLEDLCKVFFLSKTTLCKHFKETMNCTIIQYLLRIKINKSMDLLLFTKNNLEQISAECGFSSPEYFREAFRKQVGVSPTYYRKQNNDKAKKQP